MAKRLNFLNSVTHANQFDRTVLDGEMRMAFERMPQSFREADRRGCLSPSDRQSSIGCFLLSAEPPSEEVRKLYKEKLREVWKEHFCAA